MRLIHKIVNLGVMLNYVAVVELRLCSVEAHVQEFSLKLNNCSSLDGEFYRNIWEIPPGQRMRS